MTDNEIIKALECFAIDKDFDETHCIGCAFEHQFCTANMSEDIAIPALDLINRQKAEIERLKDILIKLRELHDRAKGIIATQNGEIEQLKEELLESNIEIAELYKCKFSAEDVAQNIVIAKAEAIKEFAERFKKRIAWRYTTLLCEHLNEIMDDIVEEMVGDVDGKVDS